MYMKITNAVTQHAQLQYLSVGDTFKLPTALDIRTRYMVVEHLRTADKDRSNIRYVCLNTGVIYKTPTSSGDKEVIQVDMEAKDVR